MAALLLLPLLLSGIVAEVVDPVVSNTSIPLVLGPSVPLKTDDPQTGVEVSLVTRRGLDTSEITVRENLQGFPGQGYYMSFQMGTPAQKVNALIDTGSANFALAGKKFPELSTFFDTARSSSYQTKGTTVYVPYTQGSWEGTLGSDLASLPPSMSSFGPFRTEFVSITSADKFFITGAGWEGIVGLAYGEIARPLSSPAQPFFDALIASTNGKVPNVFSVQLCGSAASLLKRSNLRAAGRASDATDIAAKPPTNHGSFVVGGIDARLAAGPFRYAPVRREWYYEVILTRIAVNGATVIEDCKELNFDKTIVDTGTTDLRLPQRVFNGVVKRLKAVVNAKPGTFVINDDFYHGKTMLCVAVGNWGLFSLFPAIDFDMQVDEWHVMRLTLSPQQYLRYVGFYRAAQSRDCFKFGLNSAPTGTVLGSVFLEGFYTVFDRVNKRVGFSNSVCSYIGGTSPNSTVSGPFRYNGSSPTSDCGYEQPQMQNFIIEIVCVVLGILCILIFIPIVFLLFRGHKRTTTTHFSSSPAAAAASSTPPPPSAPPGRRDDRSYLLSR